MAEINDRFTQNPAHGPTAFFEQSTFQQVSEIHSNIHKRTTTLLKQGRLNEALLLMCDFYRSNNNMDSYNVAEQIRDNYSRLLQYFESGSKDPSRQDQLNALFSKAWSLADFLLVNQRTPSDEYLSDSITSQMIQEFQQSDKQGQEREDALGLLFSRIRGCYPLNRDVRLSLHELMLDEDLPLLDRSILLSAILLNLLQWFDADMLENIYTYTLDDQPSQIRVQAYVTLALCGICYDDRICHEPRLNELYRMLVESAPDLLSAMQIIILHCKMAKNFRQKLTNVVKVELTNVQLGRPHMSFKDFLNFFHDGIDHDYEIFKQFFKSQPFFTQPEHEHHWLMPFSMEQEWIRRITEEHPDATLFLQLMSRSITQTDTTKYLNLCIVERNLPAVLEQLKAQSQQIELRLKDIQQLDGYTMMKNYLHDLYRYLTLNEKGKCISNPLEDPGDFINCKCLREEEEDLDRLESISKALFSQNSWEEARTRLERLTQRRVTPELLEMQAKAAENAGNYASAEEALLREMSLYSANEAIYLQLAKLYNSDKRYVAEETLLHEALKQYPEDPALLLQMSICLNQQSRYAEALGFLLRIEPQNDQYLDKQRLQQKAFALLASGNGAEAEQQISPLLEDSNAEPGYWKLAVIIALHNRDLSTAISRYKRLIQLTDKNQAFLLLKNEEEFFFHSKTDLSALTLLNDMNK